MANDNFPKPGLGSIAAAVSGFTSIGGGGTGLKIPGIEIDPRHNFVRGTYIYAKLIDRLGMQFKSFKEPLELSLRKVVVPSTVKNFDSQGRPPWQKLSKGTIYDRQMKSFGRGPILHRTGRLAREATKLNIWTIEDNTLKLRTVYFDQKVPYAGFMQLGARRGSGRIPARPYIRLQLEEEAEIYNIFVSFMVEKVNKHWGGGTGREGLG